ncbi:hypothetical protein V5096_18160 [Pseudoalteromonas carrageenovora]|uniref:hypothetical protein n=1 Tax=Pseudoalteromonas carrageenovora TaxID=227 RepID=UPI002FD23B63
MRQLKEDTVKANQIEFKPTQFGPVCVYQNTLYKWLTLAQNTNDDVVIQGIMNLKHNEQVLIPINQCMFLFLLSLKTTNLNILNLGLGTAGFERTMYYLNDRTAYINSINTFNTVEINPIINTIAKQHFNLPSHHNVYIQSAEHYIKQCTNTFDVIAIDIFSGEHHQPFLTCNDFWQNITRCSAKHSQILVNLNPQTGQELQVLLVLLRQHFKCIAIIEFNEYKNIVVILSQQTLIHINVEEIQNSPVFKQMAPLLYKEINSIYHIE